MARLQTEEARGVTLILQLDRVILFPPGTLRLSLWSRPKNFLAQLSFSALDPLSADCDTEN